MKFFLLSLAMMISLYCFSQTVRFEPSGYQLTSDCYRCLSCPKSVGAVRDEQDDYELYDYFDLETHTNTIDVYCDDKFIGRWKLYKTTECDGVSFSTDIKFIRTENGFNVTSEIGASEFRMESSAMNLIRRDAMAYCSKGETRKSEAELLRLYEEGRISISSAIPETNIPDSNFVNSRWLVTATESYELSFPESHVVAGHEGYTWKMFPARRIIDIDMEYQEKNRIYSIVQRPGGYVFYSLVNNKIDSTTNIIPLAFGWKPADSVQPHSSLTRAGIFMRDSLRSAFSNNIVDCKTCYWEGQAWPPGSTISKGPHSGFDPPATFTCKIINNYPQWTSTFCSQAYFGDPGGFCAGITSFSQRSSPGRIIKTNDGYKAYVIYKQKDRVNRRNEVVSAGKYVLTSVTMEELAQLNKGVFPEAPAPPKKKSRLVEFLEKGYRRN
ncbi:hypothetical protein [Foetidibacter luteolus]|uniref:hypothetical protein n=1 Tax=Foetidibacter luteolus TaxID=2608880 RepID=UPI00129B2570|nr:hypothetical protein [Foetidibacter luteolus]